MSPGAAAALKEAALLSLGEPEIAIQMAGGLHAATVERRRAEIEGVFARVLGRPAKLVVRTGPVAAPSPEVASAVAAPSIAQTEAAEKQAKSARLQEAARTHPNVREAAKILEGGITKIEEL